MIRSLWSEPFVADDRNGPVRWLYRMSGWVETSLIPIDSFKDKTLLWNSTFKQRKPQKNTTSQMPFLMPSTAVDDLGLCVDDQSPPWTKPPRPGAGAHAGVGHTDRRGLRDLRRSLGLWQRLRSLVDEFSGPTDWLMTRARTSMNNNNNININIQYDAWKDKNTDQVDDMHYYAWLCTDGWESCTMYGKSLRLSQLARFIGECW